MGGHTGADRVALDVAEDAPEMVVVERAGEEAVLPEVARALAAGVEVLSVAAVYSL